MKILITLLVLLASTDPSEIVRNNRIKAEAEKAYNAGDFKKAAEKYSLLYDSLNVTEDEIALNLGHSYYALGDSSNARSSYQAVTTSSNRKLKSIAYQQLGVMAKTPQTLQQSLAHLKSAVKADPTNEAARYNYEVVKKLLEKQQEQENDKNKDQKDQNQDKKDQDQQQKDQQQNKDQEKQDQQKQDQEKQDQQQKDQEQQDQEQKDQQDKEKGDKGEQEKKQQQDQKEAQDGEKSDEEKQKDQELSTKQKLKEMNISEEKAKMILEAMKNNEIQYIQQQKRKANKRPDSGKPDW